mmetsp:Transcript_2747/g.3370  ORF Transcript_2747/g.3370 Transcript_2747/m.3370 type:complete len:125 (+) Transcript_2747:48-422(+)
MSEDQVELIQKSTEVDGGGTTEQKISHDIKDDIKDDNNVSSNNDVNLDELIQQRISLENDIKHSDNQINLLQNQQRILQKSMDKHTTLLSRYEMEMDELKKELTNISQTPNKRNNNNNNNNIIL